MTDLKLDMNALIVPKVHLLRWTFNPSKLSGGLLERNDISVPGTVIPRYRGFHGEIEIFRRFGLRPSAGGFQRLYG
jgi:hypothetical protein